jgi:hypothetical protein
MSTDSTTSVAMDRWRSFHIHYHASLDRLLLDFLPPLLTGLIDASEIDRFFFVRYELGGPHLRLRLRLAAAPDPGLLQVNSASSRVAQRAAAFFRQHPSTRSRPPEQIQQHNETILASDPHETDGSVYPDNHFRAVTLVPETDRYGGPSLQAVSFDYFMLSSVAALRFLHAHGEQPRARQLPLLFRLLAREAAGFARDADELMTLVAYSFTASGSAMSGIVQRGERVFDERNEFFCRLLESSIAAKPEVAAPTADLGTAAHRLAAELVGVEPEIRLRIASSQMHMTANRLGLGNPEEVYIGYLIWRAAQELGSTSLARHLACHREHAEQAAERQPLPDLIRAVLEELCLGPRSVDSALESS